MNSSILKFRLNILAAASLILASVTALHSQPIEINRFDVPSLIGVSAFDETNDNNFVFLNYSSLYHPRIFSMDSLGNQLWHYTSPDTSFSHGIVATPSGTICLISPMTGSQSQVLKLIKLNTSGELIDTLVLAESPWGNPEGTIKNTADGNLIVFRPFYESVGDTSLRHIYLAKVSPDLDILWEHITIDTGQGSTDFVERSDGGLTILSQDSILLTNSGGEIIQSYPHSTTLHYPNPHFKPGWSKIKCASDGGYFIAGSYSIEQFPGGYIIQTNVLQKVDSTGTTEWTFGVGSGMNLNPHLDLVNSQMLYFAGDTLYSFGNDSVPEWAFETGLEYSIGHSIKNNRYAIVGLNRAADSLDLQSQMVIYQLPDYTNTTPETIVLPSEIQLLPVYPNPFNPGTTIRYELPQTEFVNVSIYDVQGRLISELTSQVQSAGRYAIQWNGKDNSGRHVPSGIYLCKLTTPDYSQTQKLILLR